MILAHFGPGVYERVGLQPPLIDILLLVGRFATPTFIAVFGFSLAFAYFPAATRNPRGTRDRLLRRSGTVLLAAVLVSIPAMSNTLSAGEAAGPVAFNLGLNIYGVLFFYFLAILVTALVIHHLARSSLAAPAVAGAVLIFVGTWLGHDSWPPGDEGLVELLRLFLVSGQYALLVNLGMALLMAALGWHLRELRQRGAQLGPVLLVIGLVLLLCGLSLGRLVGWRTLPELHSDFSAPPQLWFLIVICGVMLLTMAFLDAVKLPFVSYFLEHTGRNPLTIYVAHTFVLPGVAVLRSAAPNIPEGIAIALPMALFMGFWAIVLIRSGKHRGLSDQRSAKP